MLIALASTVTFALCGMPDCPMMRKRELLKTVPILGTAICTKELLQKYVDAPASEGEGVVVNTQKNSFKSKSQDYYSKIKLEEKNQIRRLPRRRVCGRISRVEGNQQARLKKEGSRYVR